MFFFNICTFQNFFVPFIPQGNSGTRFFIKIAKKIHFFCIFQKIFVPLQARLSEKDRNE